MSADDAEVPGSAGVASGVAAGVASGAASGSSSGRAVRRLPADSLPRPAPLSELRAQVAVLLSDVDGTMTTGGRIEAATFGAIERLIAAGVPVIPVTGRSAGFGHTLLSAIAAPAVVTENGAVTFVRDGHQVRKLLALPEADIAMWRHRMREAVAEVQRVFPQLRLSTDSAFREVDLALDWNEEVSVPVAQADAAVELLRQHGLAASRSNVHVNFAPPFFDKRTACLRLISEVFGDAERVAQYAYVGDSLNDAPMFDGFPISVGVANILGLWPTLPHHPRYVTAGREAAGFRELIEHLISLRSPG